MKIGEQQIIGEGKWTEVNREDKKACGIDESMVKDREDGGVRYERLTRIA